MCFFCLIKTSATTFCVCVLSEMYTSMEGSCYIENFSLFSNFQCGFKDKDMVCLNVCPLVNSKLITEVLWK